MSQPDLLTLAQQGDPRAIAFLINQALRTKDITAKVNRQEHHLHLLLEAKQLPAQTPCVQLIQNGMARLKPAPIYRITIYGRKVGQQKPGWTQTLTLQKSPPAPQPLSSPPPDAGEIHHQIAEQLRQVVQSSPQRPSHTAASHTQPKKRPPKPTPQTRTQAPKPQKRHPQKTTPVPAKSRFWLISLSLILLPLLSWALVSRATQLTAWLTNIPSTQTNPSEALEPVPPAPTPSSSPLQPQPTVAPSAINSVPPAPTLTEVSETAINALKSPLDPQTRLTLKAVGDIVPGTNFPYNKLPASGAQLFKPITPLLKDADLVFGNFESTLTDYAYSAKDVSRGMVFAFRSPPSYNQYLKAAGFDVLSVANNHSFDFGDQGFKDTMTHINQAGMQAFGDRGQIVYQTVKGISVAFIGFSYFDDHNSMHDLAWGKQIVQKAQEKADIIVISVHAGAEGSDAVHVRNQDEYFYGENRGNMVKFSRTMIDAGADLVLGHGPHVPRAMEVYQGKLIAYSLGNFVGYRTLSTVGNLGYSLVLEVQMNPEGDFVAGKIHPVQLDSSGIPYPDSQGSSIQLIQSLTQSDFPNTPLKIESDGTLSLQ